MRWRAQRRVPMFARSPRGARLGLRPYGVAVVATLVATGLTAACHQLGLGDVEFAWFFISIALSSSYGAGPGVFAGVLAGMVTNLFFIPPLFDLEIELDDVLRTTVYVTVSLMIGKLVRARQRAEAEVQDREGLLSYVAHELRTPLGTIGSWAELIRRGTIPAERLPHAAEVILRNGQILARITGDLLDLSRIALGGLSLRREPLDPGQMVSDCVASARETAHQKGVALEEALRPVGRLLADRERLSQVVGNVLNNAIRFTPAGGEVRVRLREEGRRAVLTVTDTGAGIPADLLPRIFEPGMRHAGSEGFGLGLTIAKDIVEHHGGTISAHSDGQGRGASFTIVLPVA